MTHVTRTTRRAQKKFRTENCFGPKNFFLDSTLILDQTFSHPKKFLDLKFFRPKTFIRSIFCYAQNSSWNQNFFRPKICSDPKWISMKMIFGGIIQSFWTWGFLNCQSQRFYLNWSLTLKTKFYSSFNFSSHFLSKEIEYFFFILIFSQNTSLAALGALSPVTPHKLQHSWSQLITPKWKKNWICALCLLFTERIFCTKGGTKTHTLHIWVIYHLSPHSPI